MIGPIFVVPNPTLVTPIYSSSTNNISFGFIVDIPLKEIIDVLIPNEPPTFPLKVCVILVDAIGYWTKSSTVIIHLVFLSFIVNLWAFPSPREVNVVPIPLEAAVVVIATLKVSSVNLIAYTVDGSSPPGVTIALVPIPIIVDFGV